MAVGVGYPNYPDVPDDKGGLGLPFFAGGAFGFAQFAGPTGGYLMGFLPAVWLVGLLCERGWGKSFRMRALAMALGTGAIFAVGLVRLSAFVPAESLAGAGLIPFLPGAAVKILGAALVAGGIGALGSVRTEREQ